MEREFITRSELVSMFAEKEGLTTKEARRIMESYESLIYDVLMDDCEVGMGKLGKFKFYDIGEHKRKDFAIGEIRVFPKRSGVKFKVANPIKKVVKERTSGK